MNGPVFVTGAAGFIGSNLVDRLLADGVSVVGCDNFSTGRAQFLAAAQKHPQFRLVRVDLRDADHLAAAMQGCATVVHLAANADVRHGLDHPRRDLEQNTVATVNVLEAMRAAGIRDFAFASTGSVYGDSAVFPTPEDAPMPHQTSLYGASKLAAEGFISAWAGGFGLRARIFRFVSILGARYTHGHVFDFVRQLRANPARLRILGDGTARKSYLAVEDCIEAIMTVMSQPVGSHRFSGDGAGSASEAGGFTEIYNLGTNECCQVSESAGWISATLGLDPTLEYSGGDRGWVGDNPFILLETKKIRHLGWTPRLTIREGITGTVAWLQANPWLFEHDKTNA
jgi:UDP-glucose 4-epimerase